MMVINATIEGIDSTNHILTLRDDMGNVDAYAADRVQRFNELKVGQKVRIRYYESIVFQALKPGEAAGGTSYEAALTRAKSALPAGTLATQAKATVTVKSIDPKVPSITVTTEKGGEISRRVLDPKAIANLKPGDRIDITFTRALLVDVEAAK
jgi:Cu/Ag efflux protein CusF